MGRISDDDIARVRDATDLVAVVSERVVLKQKGRLFWGNCPFHGEKTPSFKIDPATQLWHCFGCGLGGDVFGYVMRTENVEFPDSVRILADRANIELHEQEGGVPRSHKERLVAACDEAAQYYHKVLTGSRDSSAAQARDYLTKRGFGSDVAKDWTLGFAPGRGALVKHLSEKGFSADEMVGANLALKGDDGRLKDRFYGRVMFPIRDLTGRVIAFGGRVVGAGEPKYLNTNDTPIFKKSQNLYAIERAKGAIVSDGGAVVCEGYTDVIALHRAGITSAVATLGTALTVQHTKLLGRFATRIVYLFDGDEAGMRAADRAVEFIDASATPEAGRSRTELYVAVIPDGLDPADYTERYGPDAMRKLISEAAPLLRFAIDRRLARWDLERPEERSRALPDAVSVLVPVKGSLLAQDYASYIAGRLMCDVQVVMRALDKARPATVHAPEDPSDEPRSVEQVPLSTHARLERDMLALMVHSPAERGRAQELLSQGLLTEKSHIAIAEVIAGADAGTDPRRLMADIGTAVPGSAELLSGADEFGKSDVQDAAIDVMRRLKEFDVERRIATGKARLAQPESLKVPGEDDDLIREISMLQRRLDALRRGEIVTD